MSIATQDLGSNIFDSITLGTIQGVKLAVNVGAMLLVFVAFISLINELLFLFGEYSGLNESLLNNKVYSELSLEMVFGYLFAPIAWLIGIPFEDILLAGQLLGEKTVANEFIAYDRSCTQEINGKCIVSGESVNDPILHCSNCCNSKFVIIDGSVTEGPANQALKKYNTHFDGTMLYITN